MMIDLFNLKFKRQCVIYNLQALHEQLTNDNPWTVKHTLSHIQTQEDILNALDKEIQIIENQNNKIQDIL